MNIPKKLGTRRHTPVLNKFTYSPKYAEFHIVIYYIDEHKCKIILRKIDDCYGWGNPFTITLFSVDKSTSCAIQVPAWDNNFLQIVREVPVSLVRADVYREQKIPKVIMQTAGQAYAKNTLHDNSIMSWIELNPEYEYRFFDDTDARKFIAENFEEDVVMAYDMLIPGAYRADLFRYCYLYACGGCYFDCKMIARVPIREMIEDPNQELILCEDAPKNMYWNAVMMCVPRHPCIAKAVNMTVQNILTQNLTAGVLGISGPVLLYNSCENNHHMVHVPFVHEFAKSTKSWTLSFRHSYMTRKSDKEIMIWGFYNGYYDKYAMTSNYYGVLYNKKEVYYTERCTVANRYDIWVYPHKQHYKFGFGLENGKLIMKRVDTDRFGWRPVIQLKIVDRQTHRSINFKVAGTLANKAVLQVPDITLIEESEGEIKEMENQNVLAVLPIELENTVTPETPATATATTDSSPEPEPENTNTPPAPLSLKQEVQVQQEIELSEIVIPTEVKIPVVTSIPEEENSGAGTQENNDQQLPVPPEDEPTSAGNDKLCPLFS